MRIKYKSNFYALLRHLLCSIYLSVVSVAKYFHARMGGMHRRLYSDIFEDFHTNQLSVNRLALVVKFANYPP